MCFYANYYINFLFKNQVICLLGAPGVGKTSLVEVVADCLHRDCVKIALGGVNNVTFLRGHNYTYVGAKAGAVASAF